MIADQIARWLHARNIGVDYRPNAAGGNTFVDDMPDEPDTGVYVGTSAGPGADSKLGYDSPRVQIITRSLDRMTAYDLARAIYGQLQGLNRVTFADGTYVVGCIGIQSEPAPIGKDARGRYEYSTNYQLEVRALTAHRE